MPIYEYSCRRCHHRFEQIVRSTREEISCPECESRAVKKELSLFSSPGSQSKKNAAGAAGCSCTPQTCGCH
jgi:putative FmdB family regulatory protein